MGDKAVDKNTLRKAQLKMLDILVAIDEICKKYNIEYWLDAGTLLGAYRHGGFIPWDDDIDICMERDSFNRFINLNPKCFPRNLFLQTPETDKYYLKRSLPCKVRLNNTYFFETGDEKMPKEYNESHRGIFIDVFPMDKYSNNVIIRNAIERLFVKFFYLKTISVYKKHKSLSRLILSSLMKAVPWRMLYFIRKLQCDFMNSSNRKEGRLLGFGIEVPLDLGYTKKDLLYPLSTLEFEGYSFPVPKNAEEWLKVRYGEDYMTLPPESKRVWHASSIKF